VTGPARAAMRAAETLRRSGKRAVAELSGLRGKELAAYASRWGFTEIIKTQ